MTITAEQEDLRREIGAIESAWDRALAAQEAVRALEPKETRVRGERDAAALAALAPYARAAERSNQYRAAAKAQYEGYWAKADDGTLIAMTQAAANQYQQKHPDTKIVYHPSTLTRSEYLERLETARKMRTEDFAAAKARGEEIVEPVEIYAALGLKRNLLVRLVSRRGSTPDIPEPMKVGKAAAAALAPVSAQLAALRALRDKAIEELIAEGVQSVDIANHLGLTPARVTQIRYGGHR